MSNRLFDFVRYARKALKARLPYVRRREYRILRERHDALIDAFTVHSRAASDAKITPLKPLHAALKGEICLFVSYAAQAELKPHVRRHLEALADAGIRVVLVVNTELASITVESSLLDRLAGCYIRENRGFDFAAWGHLYAIGEGFPKATRLLLVNDSVIGPLNAPAFAAVIERLRGSTADVVGLTQNAVPHRHLQSYFLCFGPRALRSAVVSRTFMQMRSLPTKSLVIDVYETALTRQFEQSGLSVAALFPPLSKDPHSADDTLIRWKELIAAGFPYVKASLLGSPRQSTAVRAAVPAELLPRL